MSSNSQQDRILWQLQAAYPNWVPAPTHANTSLQYSLRIFGLRHAGWQIANKFVIGSDGVKRGYFMLATPGTYPNPEASRDALEPKDAKALLSPSDSRWSQKTPTGTDSLFDDFLTPEPHYEYPD